MVDRGRTSMAVGACVDYHQPQVKLAKRRARPPVPKVRPTFLYPEC